MKISQQKLDNIINDPTAGFYLINKPKGEHSFKAVSVLRQVLNIKKVGFAGTLDPLASGLLILATGKATKLLDYFHTLPKTYLAAIEFGKISDTYDLAGEIQISRQAKEFSQSELTKKLKKFQGKQSQTVPAYSAKKVSGQKLHKLARAGKQVKLPQTKIEIYKLKIREFKYPKLVLEIQCSAGTYIRSLAHDLGQSLNTGAVLINLQRTKIGKFNVADALSLTEASIETLAKYRLEVLDIMSPIKNSRIFTEE